MTDILKLARLQIGLTVLFVFLKLIRRSVLNSDAPEIFKIILLSLPNFFEALIGTLMLTGIGLWVNNRLNEKYQLAPQRVYLLVIILTGVFVVTQELNIFNLRGDNTMDYYDVAFSIIGLVIGYGIIHTVKPRIYNNS